MLKNHFKIGWRNIRRHKLYSSINIGGLALGLAVGILLLIWVQDEMSFDRFHKNGKNIYRLSASFSSGNDVQTWNVTPGPLAPTAKRSIPAVVEAVRLKENWNYSRFTVNDKTFFDVKSFYVDPAFFTMFTFPLLKGKVFTGNESVLITRKAAIKYFGTEDVVGRTIVGDQKYPFQISGVLKDIPVNSSIQSEIFMPFSILAANYSDSYWKELDKDWGNFNFDTYVQLVPGTNAASLSTPFVKLRPNQDEIAKFHMKFNFQPIYGIHLYNADLSEGSIKIVRIFLIVAIVILLIACVNYINLSTARALQRAGEIGVRKMIGAERSQLFAQFLWESLLLFILALAGALLIIMLLMPFYNNVTGKELKFSLYNLQLFSAIGVSMLLTLLIAGIYPAVLLSSFNPLKTLKGRISLGGGTVSFRKVLVIVQFVIATVLIVSTLIVGQQLRYIRNKALGYDKENVLQFGLGKMTDHIESVREELLAVPGVKGVAVSNNYMLENSNSTGDVEWDGKTKGESIMAHVLGTDKDYLKVMKLELAGGEYFRGVRTDSNRYVINETMAKMMGMKDAVGKRLKIHETEGTIIGVVKDFHYASLHEKINPMVFYYDPKTFFINIKTTGKDAPKAVAAAEKLFKQYNGDLPFNYVFMDQEFDKMYRTDMRTGKLFNYFAGIAIFISCLGLFGLATFATFQRTKEIGVRKVMGASVMNIITLLSADFLKIVLLSILLAVPVAWYAMHKWLQDYAYRVSVEWWVFVVAGITAILIALLTVSFQSVKAALMNPVKSLKTE